MTCLHFHFDQLESTQDRAFELLEQNSNSVLLVTADQQTRGRGRRGREWTSEEGRSLLLSLGFKTEARGLEGLSLVAGLAAREAIDLPEIQLKWPNDLMLRDLKVGGILVESRSQGVVAQVVVGIGINMFSLQTSNYAGLGKKVDAERIGEVFEQKLKIFQKAGFAPFQSEFESVLWRKDQWVDLSLDGKIHKVRVLGVTETGQLKTENCGVLQLTDQGEILASA